MLSSAGYFLKGRGLGPSLVRSLINSCIHPFIHVIAELWRPEGPPSGALLVVYIENKNRHHSINFVKNQVSDR